ncbi:MAG: hypothetical protein ABSD96_11500 [Candidatus Korobacteraceae bacterium]|jgi:hypothetical protein
MHLHEDKTMKDRFLKGVLLAWVSFFVFIVPGLIYSFRGISENKATGMGAVAGGVSEGLMTFGVAAMMITQIASIILLARTFEKGHSLRSLFSVVSICCSLLLVSITAVFVWLIMRTAR